MRTRIEFSIRPEARNSIAACGLTGIYFERRAQLIMSHRMVVDSITKAEGRRKTLDDILLQDQYIRGFV